MRSSRALVVAVALAAPVPALAQPSPEELAMGGRHSWDAFVCSEVARRLELGTRDRFVRIGVEKGRPTVDALLRRELSPELVGAHIPIGFRSSISTIGTDFSLGAVYARAIHAADNSIRTSVGEAVGLERDARLKLGARNMYVRTGCDRLLE